jgi:hypothetical protein
VETTTVIADTVASDPGRMMTDSVPRTTLPVHGTTRYLRTHLAVVAGVLEWEVPRSVLGIVPLGSRLISVPVREVAAVRMRRMVPHPVRLGIGLVLVVAPWLLLPWWVSLPLLILGLWTLLVAVGPHLEVVTTDGATHRAPICFGHQFDAELYKSAVESILGAAPES